MADPGDVVTVDFLGATGPKRRPAVVVSSALYHQHRPDLVLGVLTSQISRATTPLDYLLQDWASAGFASTLRISGLLWDGHPDHSAGDWASLTT